MLGDERFERAPGFLADAGGGIRRHVRARRRGPVPAARVHERPRPAAAQPLRARHRRGRLRLSRRHRTAPAGLPPLLERLPASRLHRRVTDELAAPQGARLSRLAARHRALPVRRPARGQPRGVRARPPARVDRFSRLGAGGGAAWGFPLRHPSSGLDPPPGRGVGLLGAFLSAPHLQVWTPTPAVASRMNITFGDPNITARFLTLGACAAVIVYASRQGPSWLTVAAAVACAVVIPLTFSRSGLALVIISVALAIGFALNRRRAAAIGVAALLAFVISTGVNPDTRQRATDAAFTAVSAVTGATAHHRRTAGGAH